MFYGDIVYLEETSELAEDVEVKNVVNEHSHTTSIASEDASEDSAQIGTQVDEAATNESVQYDFKTNSASLESIIESQLQQIDNKISSLATSENLDRLQSLVTKLSNESNSVLGDIKEQLVKQTENANMVPTTSINQDDTSSTLNKPVIVAAVCLIVGFILGALIF